MFLQYTIDGAAVSDATRFYRSLSYEEEYDEIKDVIRSTITANMLESALIDGTRLQNEWFPTNRYFHVFLSHSYAEIEKAKQLAAYLKKRFQINTFIDSCYWGYANELIEKLDRRFQTPEDRPHFDYDKRNFTTSVVHSMLSMALMKMMSKTECVIFLNSNNSLKYDEGTPATLSPWIYEEIEFANRLQHRIPRRWMEKLGIRIPVCESREIIEKCFSADDPQVMFDLELTHFHKISSNLLNSMSNTVYPYDALDELHEDYVQSHRRILPKMFFGLD